jgi:hypothetical protein
VLGLQGGDGRHGLGVESIEPHRLVMRRGWWGFSRDPATIEVLLSEAGPRATSVVLNGRLKWERSGRELNREMNRFRNALEVAARNLARRDPVPPAEEAA